jgi:hypothetical protein
LEAPGHDVSGWRWGVAVAYKAFQKFGEKWLDARFAERLEKLKHEQTKEIEGTRRKVPWEFSRISKIHEKEFEVLPKAWLMLQEARGWSRSGSIMTGLDTLKVRRTERVSLGVPITA